MEFGRGGTRNHSEKDVISVSPEQKQVIQALTVLCFSTAIKVFFENLLPMIVQRLAGP